MTTADLLDAIARTPGTMTLDDVAERFECPRRSVEECVQQARLAGHPVITDGGLRLARTSDEARALLRALRRRMATQTRTAWAVRSAVMLMERGEAAARKRAIADAAAAEQARAAAAAARHAAAQPEPLSLWPVAHG